MILPPLVSTYMNAKSHKRNQILCNPSGSQRIGQSKKRNKKRKMENQGPKVQIQTLVGTHIGFSAYARRINLLFQLKKNVSRPRNGICIGKSQNTYNEELYIHKNRVSRKE